MGKSFSDQGLIIYCLPSNYFTDSCSSFYRFAVATFLLREGSHCRIQPYPLTSVMPMITSTA